MTPLVLLAASLLAAAPASPARPVPAAVPAPTVAVLYFDYDGKSEELAMLRKGLAQMLISDLAGGGSVQVVERSRLQEVLEELELNRSAKFDRATANKLGRLLGARFLVMGSYFEVLGSLRIDARAVETETGRVVHSIGANGKPDDFLEIEQRIARSLGEALAAAAPPVPKGEGASPARPQRATPPKRLPAKVAVRYSQALDAIDRDDRAAAREDLEAVIREQPDFQLASRELASLVQ